MSKGIAHFLSVALVVAQGVEIAKADAATQNCDGEHNSSDSV